MKLTDLITEAALSQEPSDIARLIFKMCQPYLRDIDYNVSHYEMFRGLRISGSKLPHVESTDTMIKEPRAERRPFNTHPEQQDIIDNYFLNNFGHKFRSDKVLFTTGHFTTASEYGTPFVIFPIGDYKYCWSQIVEDLYFTIPTLDVDDDAPANLSSEQVDKLITSLYNAKYQNNNMKAAITSTHEIMIHCQRYIAVHPDQFPTVVKELEELLKEG